MGGNEIHATVDFNLGGIVENRHAFPHMLLGNAVMMLEQRHVGVPTHGHQLSLFHYIAFLWKWAKIVLLTAQEHLPA